MKFKILLKVCMTKVTLSFKLADFLLYMREEPLPLRRRLRRRHIPDWPSSSSSPSLGRLLIAVDWKLSTGADVS